MKDRKKKVFVKSKFKELLTYKKWTEVSPFLATGLVGVKRKI